MFAVCVRRIQFSLHAFAHNLPLNSFHSFVGIHNKILYTIETTTKSGKLREKPTSTDNNDNWVCVEFFFAFYILFGVLNPAIVAVVFVSFSFIYYFFHSQIFLLPSHRSTHYSHAHTYWSEWKQRRKKEIHERRNHELNVHLIRGAHANPTTYLPIYGQGKKFEEVDGAEEWGSCSEQTKATRTTYF